MHGGLTRQDLVDMDPRSLFRRPAGAGSSAAPAASSGSAAPAAGASLATGAAVGGAAAALMASGRAEEAVAEERPAVEPDPLELLGLAPAPYDVDAT